MTKIKMQLDVCFEGHVGETLEAALEELTTGTAVVTRVVQEHGPAGGWPVVEFEGEQLELLIVSYRYNGNSLIGIEDEVESFFKAHLASR